MVWRDKEANESLWQVRYAQVLVGSVLSVCCMLCARYSLVCTCVCVSVCGVYVCGWERVECV